MICYKDITWCVSDCSTECKVKLTEGVKIQAQIHNIPLAQADFKCKEYKERKVK